MGRAKKMTKVETPSLFSKIESFLEKNKTIVLLLSMALAALFSLLLFNSDVSVGGDDSTYIHAGYNFAKGISFPGWQGPFYPIFLSLFIAIFGVKVLLLKFLSVICFVLTIFFIYKVFVKIANYTIASFVSIISATSLLLNTYASSTYSEPLFFLLQFVFLFLFFKYLDQLQDKKRSIKSLLVPMLVIALFSYMLFLTRSVAGVSILFILLVLLFEKQYIGMGLYSIYIAIIHFLFSTFKKVVWGVSAAGFETQFNVLMQKNAYRPNEGTEDLMGLIHRFWENAEIYLSKHIMRMSGFLPFDSSTTSTTTTILFFIAVVICAILLWRKYKRANYLIIYIALMIGATFVLLQTHWDQDRLIMIYFPIISGIIAIALYRLFSFPLLKKLQFIPIAFAVLQFILIFVQTTKAVINYDNPYRFKEGTYYTYTPDWQNYMLASRWAGENLPDSSVVLCRKADMSWIAAEGNDIFAGITRVSTYNSDTMITMLKERKVNYVILANLRLNPQVKIKGKTITTVRNTLMIVNNKLPGAFSLVKEFGKDEKAYLFKVDFSDSMSTETYMNNLDAALIINPKNQYASSTKVNYLMQRQEYEKAISFINFVIANNPNDYSLYFSKGVCHFYQSKFREALTDFDTAIKYKKDDAQSWYNKAICHYNLNERDQAKQAAFEAQRLGFQGNVLWLLN